ncbi:MAG TPA: carboxypeptidase-like regulatory domain-containing protein [Thermoanaerobaculia bacterium]|nr:carboxypeptidase-like regulatory domain-containing protein [Thermoanaerobaculia bacterium]
MALAARPAAACSCIGGGFGEYEPCEAWGAAGIFAGKVTGVTYVMPDGTETDDQPDTRPDHRVFHFDVIEAFVGVQGKTADVVTGMGDGDCGVDFTVGESYFVYAGGDPGGTLGVSMCGDMSKPLTQAGGDLAFARQVQRGEWTAIYGRVTALAREDLHDYPGGEGMPGVTVRVWGPRGRRFEAVTNEWGYFTVKGRLRGTYTMRAVMPEGFPTPAEQEVEVHPDECAGVEIVVSSLGTIQGRVVDLHGKPVESMAVALMPVDKPHDDYQIETADTDEKGRYLFEKIPAGVYLVAANHKGPGAYGPPYQPTYYPHTGKLTNAARVTLEPAGSVKLEDIRLPPPVRKVSVTGTVRWPDGRPVEGVAVVLALNEWDGMSGDTDAEGRYEVTGYEGLRYWLVADGEWVDAVAHSKPQELVLGEELAIDLVLDHPSDIKTPGEWHRRGSKPLVPLP